jgi:hypothetical protein
MGKKFLFLGTLSGLSRPQALSEEFRSLRKPHESIDFSILVN